MYCMLVHLSKIKPAKIQIKPTNTLAPNATHSNQPHINPSSMPNSKTSTGLNWAEEADREEAERRAEAEAEAKAEAQNQHYKSQYPSPIHAIAVEKLSPANERERIHGNRVQSYRSRADKVQSWRIGGDIFRKTDEERDKKRSPAFSVTTTKIDPFGGARPREEVLAEKMSAESGSSARAETVKEVLNGSENDSVGVCSELGSYPLSRTASSVSGGHDADWIDSRPKKLNPFGDARPRELVLAERGLDYRRIDLEIEHRSASRIESGEGKLKQEIEELTHSIEAMDIGNNKGVGRRDSDDYLRSLKSQLMQKQNELQLIQVDSEVHFSKKKSERPALQTRYSDSNASASANMSPAAKRTDASQEYISGSSTFHSKGAQKPKDYQYENMETISKSRFSTQGNAYSRYGREVRYSKIDVTDSDSEFFASRRDSNVNWQDAHTEYGISASSSYRDIISPQVSSSHISARNDPGRPYLNSERFGFAQEHNLQRVDPQSGYLSAPQKSSTKRRNSKRSEPTKYSGDNVSGKHGHGRFGSSWQDDPIRHDFQRPGEAFSYGDVHRLEGTRSASRPASVSGRNAMLLSRGDPYENESPRRSVFDRLGPPANQEKGISYDAGQLDKHSTPVNSFREFDDTNSWEEEHESNMYNESMTPHGSDRLQLPAYQTENQRADGKTRVLESKGIEQSPFRMTPDNRSENISKRRNRGRRDSRKR